ncbi:putative proline dehydrogenase [Medicago truncatula]|uniref:Proline dehydrogenase n=1 Tax=Medicago truncatula TaxID=3880 RepID=A0A396HAI8_MEDTR|nr:proline dehydrogenase 1, mitochondrial [Medicago truncatula]RHN50342.1 putative proline dehydrogenase [Medicago truncatula]
MATRVVPQKIIKNLRFKTTTKPLNSSHPSATAAVASLLEREQPSPPQPSHQQPSYLDLNDGERLFSAVPTSTLIRSSAVLHATAIGPVVDVGIWAMQSKLLQTGILKDAVMAVTKRTFYEHFCAGEDAITAGKSIRSVNEAGLRGMLVFGVEDAHENDGCDRNLKGFLHTVDVSKSLPPSSVSFVIVKITAICPMALLERISDLLRWQQKDPSFNLPWKQDSLPIFSESSPLYHTTKKPEPLTPQEESDFQLANQRLQQLCKKCVEANMPLLVDAEHTTVQPAIDYFTYSSAIMHNKDDNPIVFGTIQTYLKDAKERLFLATQAAEKIGIPMGFKLVRGAYMSTESTLAESFGSKSPIHDTIKDTHNCFNDCSSYLLEKFANGKGSVVLATHNIESGKLAAAKAYEIGIGKVNHKLEFAQLCGMSDALSFGLSNAGFRVSKYMPFGPVEMVMPYLLRRAEENRGLLAASGFDRQLIRRELGRRLKAAIF